MYQGPMTLQIVDSNNFMVQFLFWGFKRIAAFGCELESRFVGVNKEGLVHKECAVTSLKN